MKVSSFGRYNLQRGTMRIVSTRSLPSLVADVVTDSISRPITLVYFIILWWFILPIYSTDVPYKIRYEPHTQAHRAEYYDDNGNKDSVTKYKTEYFKREASLLQCVIVVLNHSAGVV